VPVAGFRPCAPDPWRSLPPHGRRRMPGTIGSAIDFVLTQGIGRPDRIKLDIAAIRLDIRLPQARLTVGQFDRHQPVGPCGRLEPGCNNAPRRRDCAGLLQGHLIEVRAEPFLHGLFKQRLREFGNTLQVFETLRQRMTGGHAGSDAVDRCSQSGTRRWTKPVCRPMARRALLIAGNSVMGSLLEKRAAEHHGEQDRRR